MYLSDGFFPSMGRLDDLNALATNSPKMCVQNLLITFKALKGITDLLYLHKPSRRLIFPSECLLQVGKSSTKFYDNRSYAFAAANLWNNLPSKVRHAPSLGVFKSKLKTHLFQKHFCAN